MTLKIFPQVLREVKVLKSAGWNVRRCVGNSWKNVVGVETPIFTHMRNPQGGKCRKQGKIVLF
jgi:hypothetical protein